ncbi:MAG TPA: hypothetical protein VGM03_10270 [Phycisphaerae bacterium]
MHNTGRWNYVQTWPDGAHTFHAEATDGDGTKYIYEATETAYESYDAWDWYQVPIKEIDGPDGQVRAFFESAKIVDSNNPNHDTKTWKITRQYEPASVGTAALVYQCVNGPLDPDGPDVASSKLSAVVVQFNGETPPAGRALNVNFDVHGRLASYNDGCSSCGPGETIEYEEWDESRPTEALVSRRLDASGNVLLKYEYDDKQRVTRISRGTGSTYQVLREIELSCFTQKWSFPPSGIR